MTRVCHSLITSTLLLFVEMEPTIEGGLESIEGDTDDDRDVVASARDRRADSGGLSDDELKAVLESRQTTIRVVGCGGAGCNTVDRMATEGIRGADLVALNTDAQHLSTTAADAKLLVGRDLTGGKGTGSLPNLGERAALENEHAIHNAVRNADMVFVTAGLGGGTGTGSAPVVAQAAQAVGALTIAIVTQPFTAEGGIRRENAAAGLDRLRDAADTVIVIPNDRLLDACEGLPVQQAFKVADEVLMRAVKGITELITESRMVNLDFSDVETVMKTGGVAMIGFGESNSQRKAADALRNAVTSPLLDVDLTGAKAALVNVTGGPGMTIEQAEGVVKELHDRVDSDARIIWGTGVDATLGETLRAMVVVTGVSSEHVYGHGDTAEESREPLHGGIDYVE